MHSARALFLVLLLLPAVAAGNAARGAEFKGGTFDPPRAAPDFALQGSNGSPIGISRYRGKVVALAFGFTQCSRVCPVTLANLGRVARQLGKSAADLQVLFVTVDPARDSPERLRNYLTGFFPTFLGATGSKEQLDAVRQSYGVTVQRENFKDGLGYDVHHSSSIYLIDRQGKLRVLVPFGKPPEDIAHDIRLLLK